MTESIKVNLEFKTGRTTSVKRLKKFIEDAFLHESYRYSIKDTLFDGLLDLKIEIIKE